jgi:hypothetical protein
MFGNHLTLIRPSCCYSDIPSPIATRDLTPTEHIVGFTLVSLVRILTTRLSPIVLARTGADEKIKLLMSY